MEQITNSLIYIYDAPITIKIMFFILIKNIYAGFYKGIENFRTSDNPISQLIVTLILYTICGFIDAIFWYITFPLFILWKLDKIAKYLMRKNN